MKSTSTLFSSLIACLSIGMAGCFTEVGNPDSETNKVSATFQIDYQQSGTQSLPKSGNESIIVTSSDTNSVVITHFVLYVREAEYEKKIGQAYHIWNEDATRGRKIFLAGGINTLPTLTLPTEDWSSLVFECSLPGGENDVNDTTDTHIKGQIKIKGKMLNFAYKLPKGKELKLSYAAVQLLSWKQETNLNCKVLFYGHKWVESVKDTLWEKAVSKGDLILINSTTNMELYSALNLAFQNCFNADKTEIEK